MALDGGAADDSGFDYLIAAFFQLDCQFLFGTVGQVSNRYRNDTLSVDRDRLGQLGNDILTGASPFDAGQAAAEQLAVLMMAEHVHDMIGWGLHHLVPFGRNAC